ncbi:hypothetical protein [Thalassobacillus hwangdonensis]|uniref:YneQ n=1 Tax=Thalassobacillus hwangdonensis TaxID=546108 RepID=A0ABW3KZU8_9BACI
MAFGLDRKELVQWKNQVKNGEIALLTHYWIDERFPGCTTVTKVGCADISKLKAWGKRYNLEPGWIHKDDQYPHFDLFGKHQKYVLEQEGKWDQIEKFNL